MELTRENIDVLITRIRDAEAPGSVTNVLVADILKYLFDNSEPPAEDDGNEVDLESAIRSLIAIWPFNTTVEKEDDLYGLKGILDGYIAFVKDRGQFFQMQSGRWSEHYQDPRYSRPISTILYQLDNTLYQAVYNSMLYKTELKEYGLTAEDVQQAIKEVLEGSGFIKEIATYNGGTVATSGKGKIVIGYGDVIAENMDGASNTLLLNINPAGNIATNEQVKEILDKQIATEDSVLPLRNFKSLNLAAEDPLQVQGALVGGPEGTAILNIGIKPDSFATPKYVDAAALKVFNDRFDVAAGSFGGYKPYEAPDKSKPYLLNGLWLSYEEAVRVDLAGEPGNGDVSFNGLNIRTCYPRRAGNSSAKAFNWSFYNCRNLERVYLQNGSLQKGVFGQCVSLREVKGLYNINSETGATGSTNSNFTNCTNLEYVEGAIRSNYSIDVQWCGKLTYENFRYWLDHAYNTALVSIIVHPDIYAALTGEASYPFNGGTQEQWAQILTDAAQKQVSFGTI